MERLTRFGRTLFAVALIGLGLDHFIFGDFIVARAPAWPASVRGGLAWAYLTGSVFTAVGAAILTGRRGRSAAILAAALIFAWALLRHLPVVAASSPLSGAWTRAGKAVWFVGGALAVAATLPKATPGRSLITRFMNLERKFVTAGRWCVGLILIMNGIQHFIWVDFVASLVPRWFPGDPVFWTSFAGVALIVGGCGLLFPPAAPIAALLSGLMVFSWVFIVHLSQEISGVGDGIAIFEAPAIAGILFVIAGYLYDRKRLSRRGSWVERSSGNGIAPNGSDARGRGSTASISR
jgi:uncharacterized membrane protein